MQQNRQAAVDHAIPAWLNRLGDADNPFVTDTFNNKLGPIVGMRINPDGTVTDLGEPAEPPRLTQEAAPTGTPQPTGSAEPDRTVLEALYNATDGPNWFNNENWLSDRPLGRMVWRNHGRQTGALRNSN